MQFTLVALSALAASALATEVKRQEHGGDDRSAVYSILQTAIPATLQAEAATNPAGFSSAIVAEFASGSTPAWFASLPTSVQTYLKPVANVTAYATGASSAWPTRSANSTLPIGTGTGVLTSTLTTSASLSSSSSSGSTSAAGASSASAGAATTSSHAGASMPTALMGMGMAGVAGLIGVLAL